MDLLLLAEVRIESQSSALSVAVEMLHNITQVENQARSSSRSVESQWRGYQRIA